jgi:hypothetical protein
VIYRRGGGNGKSRSSREEAERKRKEERKRRRVGVRPEGSEEVDDLMREMRSYNDKR